MKLATDESGVLSGCMHVISIPNWHPTTLNRIVYGNTGSRHRMKRADLDMIAAYSVHVPKANGRRRVSLEITLGKGERGADADAWWKTVLDALVILKLLVGDRPEHVELMPLPPFYPRGDKKTIIKLEDIYS